MLLLSTSSSGPIYTSAGFLARTHGCHDALIAAHPTLPMTVVDRAQGGFWQCAGVCTAIQVNHRAPTPMASTVSDANRQCACSDLRRIGQAQTIFEDLFE